jgi:hypothetical protein
VHTIGSSVPLLGLPSGAPKAASTSALALVPKAETSAGLTSTGSTSALSLVPPSEIALVQQPETALSSVTAAADLDECPYIWTADDYATAAAASAVASALAAPSDRKGKGKAVGTWLGTSLHDTLRALALGARGDAAELLHALDELAHAVSAAFGAAHRRFAELVVRADTLRADALRARHRRAADKARALPQTARAWLADLRGRVHTGLDRARGENKETRRIRHAGERAAKDADYLAALVDEPQDSSKYARRVRRAADRAERNAKRLERLVGRALRR